MTFELFGKKVSGMFTIPSGIVTTNVSTIELIANEIAEIGIITTKSIGPEPRKGNVEPILTQYAPGSFMNAVGLTNPGADEFAEQLKHLKLPKDKFLLTSIFGKDVSEFVDVAEKLAPYSDGLELNLSCPHAEGYGMAIGQDADLVWRYVKAVKENVNIPVIPKLTPNVSNIGEIAKAAKDAGADAICAINTVGPGYFTIDSHPVLTNRVGGMSGVSIVPIGLKCVKDISEVVDIPIIAVGGISGANDVRAYADAGASFFGVGSALAGMSTQNLKNYFRLLQQDIEEQTDWVKNFSSLVDMSFKQYELQKNNKLAEDMSLLVFDQDINTRPGQFVFAWIPGKGEKPFSVLDDKPLTLAVKDYGCFSHELLNLKPGSKVYFRGPYGISVTKQEGVQPVLVSGGTGFAALYQIAKMYKDPYMIMGAKDKEHLFYLEEAQQQGLVSVITEDGSHGYKGVVTDILEECMIGNKGPEWTWDGKLVFYNCGPKAMIDAIMPIELTFTSPANIYNSIDYVTKCGVGICGSCSSDDGRRICVDGPFLEQK